MTGNTDTLVEDIGLDEVPFSSGDEGNPDLVTVDGLDFEIIDDGVTSMPVIETSSSQDEVDNNIDDTDSDVAGTQSQEEQGFEDGHATGMPHHLEAQLESQ